MSLLERRIVMVTGKGGVGKTTVTSALGLLLAARGGRTLMVEIAGASNVAEAFGQKAAGYEPVLVAPNLWTMSVTAEAAIEDYIVQQIKVRRLFQMVFRNRVMGPFMDAVPGLHDVIQLGKVFDLARETDDAGRLVWDHIIVDAPATGHGLTMLGAPSAMMEMTRRGPFFEGARLVHEVVDDPRRAAVVLVCLPEEMPVNETLSLYGQLGAAQPRVALCVLNEVHPLPFANREDWPVARALLSASPEPAVREASGLVDVWLQRVQRQDQARDRLREGLPVPVVDLPFLFHRDLSVAELGALARGLGAVVGARP